MSDRKKIAHIELDERTVVRRSADIEHERAVGSTWFGPPT